MEEFTSKGRMVKKLAGIVSLQQLDIGVVESWFGVASMYVVLAAFSKINGRLN